LRILIVEDNTAIATNLYDYFESLGHSVDAAGDGKTALHLATSQPFDAILLDLGLPRLDGLSLCRKLRGEARCNTPILILTARDTLEDKLEGFGCGADDFLVKPFALEEVAARLKALHARHSGRASNQIIHFGKLVYDSGNMTVHLDGTQLELTPKCLRLLGLLISEPGRLRSRQELEIELWGEEHETSERLRHHLHLLRRQLLDATGRDMIRTVHGLGYRIVDEP